LSTEETLVSLRVRRFLRSLKVSDFCHQKVFKSRPQPIVKTAGFSFDNRPGFEYIFFAANHAAVISERDSSPLLSPPFQGGD
jgi:hypothetical protein